MRKHLFRACSAASAAGITAALCLGSTAASASVAMPGSTHPDTPQCQAYNSGGTLHCITWAQSSGTGTLGLRITATGGYVNARVLLTQADSSDPMQDFLVTTLGTVSQYFNNGANDLGLNAYDNVEYGNDELVSAEFAPGGVPTDLCLANVNDKSVLRRCNGLRWQTYIEATSVRAHCTSGVPSGPGGQTPLGIVVPFGNPGSYNCAGDPAVPPASISTMLLSCAHVFDNGQHLAMTGSNTDGAQGKFRHPTQNNLQFWAYAVQP
jgi:hypothetical protein